MLQGNKWVGWVGDATREQLSLISSDLCIFKWMSCVSGSLSEKFWGSLSEIFWGSLSEPPTSFNHIMHYVPISYIYSQADAMHITKQTWHTRPPGWHDGLLPSPDKRSVSRLVGKWSDTSQWNHRTFIRKKTGETCRCFSHMIENYWVFGGIHVNSFKRNHRFSDFRWFSPLSSRGLIATVDVTVCSH